MLGSYSYAGAKTARTLFRIHAVGAKTARGGAKTARVELDLPGDGGIFATALLALACHPNPNPNPNPNPYPNPNPNPSPNLQGDVQ